MCSPCGSHGAAGHDPNVPAGQPGDPVQPRLCAEVSRMINAAAATPAIATSTSVAAPGYDGGRIGIVAAAGLAVGSPVGDGAIDGVGVGVGARAEPDGARLGGAEEGRADADGAAVGCAVGPGTAEELGATVGDGVDDGTRVAEGTWDAEGTGVPGAAGVRPGTTGATATVVASVAATWSPWNVAVTRATFGVVAPIFASHPKTHVSVNSSVLFWLVSPRT